MGNLLRMDLYRMRKAKGFWVCLILAFLFAFSMTPLYKLLLTVSRLFDETTEALVFERTVNLSDFISDPFPMLNAMLAMLSACGFFYMDLEGGYIKNIAGQMPRKGYTILSKYLAVIPYNLLFMVVGIAGNLLGSAFFQQIRIDSGIGHGLLIFFLKLLLIQSICAILLLVTTGLRSKSLGIVLSVLLGTGLLSLLYSGIDLALNMIFRNKRFSIPDYMPDQLLGAKEPKTVVSIVVSAIVIAVFLTAAIRVFDRKDVN